jgi:hypothetical protein
VPGARARGVLPWRIELFSRLHELSNEPSSAAARTGRRLPCNVVSTPLFRARAVAKP